MPSLARVFLLILAIFSVTAQAGVRLLVDSDRETLLEVTAGPLQKTVVTRQGTPHTEIRLEGFDFQAGMGKPETPYLTARLLVPHGGDFRYEIVSRKPAQAVALLYDVSYAAEVPAHDGRHRLAQKDDDAYALSYGRDLVEVEEVGFTGKDKILALRFWPIRYDAKARKLSLTPDFKIRVTYSATKTGVAANADGIARYLVLNTATIKERASSRKFDLLVAHSSYEMDLFRLVEFKVTRGRKVKTLFVDGKSADQVKALIKAEYQAAEPPTQTLLIGSMTQIPAFPGSGENYWTDYDYQVLDNDGIPDISVGRIPAANSIDLRNAVDKIIARELEPRQVQNILITSGQDTSMGCPANVTRVGENLKAAGNDVKVVKRFRTEVSTEEVIAGYNDNPNIVVYDGHGNREGMMEVPLTLSNLNKLTNNAFPIILDIACLNANWTSSANWRNFTAGILFQERRGVAGIMASGGSGDGHAFFRSIGQIMADARKNLANDTKMNEVGQVILAAKIKNGQQDRTYWNYYGDPATSVWESTY